MKIKFERAIGKNKYQVLIYDDDSNLVDTDELAIAKHAERVKLVVRQSQKLGLAKID